MHLKRLGAMALAAAVALVAMASFAAVAPAKEPAPGYSQFAGCPSPEENANITACIRTVIDGGNFKMGNKNTPLSKPMNLVGGITTLPDGTEIIVANSKGGISHVKQLVPGGVIGITGLDWLVNFLSIEALQLFAEVELMGSPKAIPGGNLQLPIRVHLVNSALGNKCYVGSPTSPIVLNLTTETTSPPLPNKPITGSPGEPFFDEATGIFHINNGKYVDNAFAAPGANGCQLTLFGFIPISLNGLVNLQAGLPAPAGTNETQQNFDIELTGQSTVYP